MSTPSRAEVAQLLREVASSFRVWWPEYLYDIGQEKAGPMHDAITALTRGRDRHGRTEDVKALRMALVAMSEITETGRMPTVYMLEGMAAGVDAGWTTPDGVPEWWRAFTEVADEAVRELVDEVNGAAQPDRPPVEQ